MCVSRKVGRQLHHPKVAKTHLALAMSHTASQRSYSYTESSETYNVNVIALHDHVQLLPRNHVPVLIEVSSSAHIDANLAHPVPINSVPVCGIRNTPRTFRLPSSGTIRGPHAADRASLTKRSMRAKSLR